MSKKEYKKLIVDAINKKDEELIKEQANGKRKCLRIFNEQYGRKSYFTEQTVSQTKKLVSE